MSLSTTVPAVAELDHEQAARLAGFAAGYQYADDRQIFPYAVPYTCPERFVDVLAIWNEGFMAGYTDHYATSIPDAVRVDHPDYGTPLHY